MQKFETIIGLEVHAQLKTASKMYCSCSTAFGNSPNSNICPVCTAQPGTLPVVNRMAVEMAIKTGLALGCSIEKRSVFARKNYFYPDLTKGYQISQFEYPICLGGRVDIKTGGVLKSIPLIRIHLEEDAGKSLHDAGGDCESHVDYNRCGVPLIEIVSGPDMRSPEEAGDYLRTLCNILIYLDVCSGNLQEGNFRCDANVSIRPVGQEKLGTRSEMKNLNSFKAVERAIAYEVKRHEEVILAGGKIIQETRLWNDAEGKTYSMRSKEEAHDYRYFPDPDLLPLIVGDDWIERVRASLPELALVKSQRFVAQYGITEYDAAVLADDMRIAAYFEDVVRAGAPAKKAANWILSELLRELKEGEIGIDSVKISPEDLAKLIALIDDGTISGKMAKDIFIDMYSTGNSPDSIVAAKGLRQVSDTFELEAAIDKVIAENGKQLEQYRSGKSAVFAFFVGQAMKATKGKGNPKMINDLLKKKLG